MEAKEMEAKEMEILSSRPCLHRPAFVRHSAMDSPLACFLLVAVLSHTLASQSNTLLLVGDDMGVDTIAAYQEGSNPARTPNLDNLAAQGVLFRNAYACPGCSPTRATIMTGRYGFRNGVGSPGMGLSLSETTLPEILDQKGIKHALIGKWHLGGGSPADDHPNQSGWGHFAGSLGGFFRSPETYYSWRRVVDNVGATTTNYATTQNVDDALGWIQAQSSAWVCSVNFNAAHTPLHTPPASLHNYNLSGQTPNSNPVLFHNAMIEAMDTEIGRLLASIPAATRANTNIIFIGDNGTERQVIKSPFIRQHGKMSLYEGGWNVPLIVQGPAVNSPGREVSALVHSVDLFHTIAEFAGLDANSAVAAGTTLDGVSFAPYLHDPAQKDLREFVYSEIFSRRSSTGVAVRGARYKLIEFDTGVSEFYDLALDPHEQVDLLSLGLSGTEAEAFDRLRSEFSRLHGEASWFAFGAGCAGTVGVPTLNARTGSRPVLGQSLIVDLQGVSLSASSAMGILGFDRRASGSLSLPLDLSGFGAQGCWLYTAMDSVQSLSLTSGGASWNLAIPSIQSLLGLRFYQQAIIFEPQVNLLGAVLSNAGEGCIEAM